jgi:RyR domain
MNSRTAKTILVTGDPICDHNYYRGNRSTADSPEKRGFRLTRTPGGALMLKELIAKATASLPGWRTEFGLKVNHETLPQDYHAYCLWEPQLSNPSEKDEKKRFEVWRAVEPTLGYGQKESEPLNEKEKSTFRERRIAAMGTSRRLKEVPAILVIDDAGLDFRRASSKDRWPFPEKSKTFNPRWIVLKLSGSIGEGDLWDKLVPCHEENLVLIVSADQLRRSDLRLSGALSWEATVEDVLAELKCNPALKPLLSARHAIITFKSDGAVWLNREKNPPSRMLVFDAANAEGDWSMAQGRGTVFGYLSCFTAAIVCELCRHVDEAKELDLESALAAGLGASRELHRLGHGRVITQVPGVAEKYEDNPNPGFPFDDIVASIHDPKDKFVSSPLPGQITDRGKWMMLDEWQGQAQASKLTRPHYEVALAVAVLGPNALERFPVARIGALLTVDRSEIESLRSLRQLISSYQAGRVQNKPLSIGVFGPPGAGKSFGVTEISKAVLGEKVEPLTFNLSQFSEPTDLIGAFHQVRDQVLTGVTPVVFWDEFDSQNYRWLQYLLAPMQDGAFQEGQIHHPIGKCIFIFAGATSPTFEDFGPRDPNTIVDEERTTIPDVRLSEIEHQWRDFVLKKGPDFKSRLAGYLNVLGPNRRQICTLSEGVRQWKDDPNDLYFPIRRAFFIRSKFKLKDSQRLQIDTGILRALIEIPQYKSGARSLEYLCLHLRQNAPDIPRRSHLPGNHLLDMHVSAATFWELCERDLPFRDAAKKLARGLHEDWRKALTDEARQKNPKAKPWSDIDPDTRNANLAQALRIPDLLALAGLRVVQGEPLSANQEKRIRQRLHEYVYIIAEAEHNHWMVERLLSGWRYAPKRDDARKLHPLLVPYAQLPDSEKEKDLRVIKGDVPHIPDLIKRLKDIEFRIEPLPSPVSIQ